MKVVSGQIVAVAGVALLLMGLLVFSLGSASTALGQTTDSGVGAGGNPPASLPAAGIAGYEGTGESGSMLLVASLAALGVTMTGAGVIVMRRKEQAQKS